MRKGTIALGTLSAVLASSCALLWHRVQSLEKVFSAMRAEKAVFHACPTAQFPSNQLSACATTTVDSARPALDSRTQPDLDLFGQVHRDPRFQAAMAGYLRIDLRQQYAAFLSSLRLTAEKEDQLMMILAQQRVRGSGGIPKDFSREEWEKRNDAELRAVLSQSQSDAFRRYRETEGTRDQVRALRDELMQTREPLRDDQIEPLVDALHPEEAQFMEEVRIFKESLDKSAEALADSEKKAETYFAEREAAATQRKLESAATILSRDQLKALKRRLEAQLALSQQGSKLRRLQFELAESLSRPEAAVDSAN
jgi:hypothetical protein